MRRVEVAIIGAGSAGLSARSEVAKLTDSYVVIDRGPIGTTCARAGCMPSKALIQVANDFHRRKVLEKMGLRYGDGVELDTKAALAHVRSLRDLFVDSVLKTMEDWQDKFIEAPARFINERKLEAGGETIEAERIVIATGSRPIIPDAWQTYQSFVLDSDSIFDLQELPPSIAVIGLGSIGLELGQALSRLGVSVHGFEPGRSLGGLTSRQLQDQAFEILGGEFPINRSVAEPVGAQNGRLEVMAGENRDSVDAVLLAVGRTPNMEALAIENAGFALNADGSLDVDPCTMRVASGVDHRIYLAGDVTHSAAVLHEAVDEGRIAGFNASRDEDHAFARRPRLAITFCEPNIAIIGDDRSKLMDRGVEFVSGSVDFRTQGRAIVMDENRGCAEVYIDRASGRLLGAELFAPAGEHMAHFLANALACGLDAQSLLATPFYHPVVEEGLRTALKRAAGQLPDELTGIDLMRCEEPPVGAETSG